MKHLILSNSSESYSVKRLIEEINIRGDEYEVISSNDLYVFLSSTTSGHDRIYRRTEKKAERILAKNFDSVIPRIAGGNFEYGATVVRQLVNNMHTFSTSSERGLKICSNKMLTAQVLSASKLRIPKQVLAHQPGDFKELINLVGGLPCVAKLQRGSLGVGVMILETKLAASTSLRSFQSLGVDVLLQQYIETGNPKNDIRAFVVGPETKEPKIFSYKRFALDEDFRSNYTISGLGEKVVLTEEEKQMAIDAALAVGLGVSGVDIMRDANNNDKPYIIEVNGSPGLKGVETVTGENIAGAIIDYIKANYKKTPHFGNKTKSESNNKASVNGLSIENNNNKKNNKMSIMNRIRSSFGQKSVTSDDFGKLTKSEYDQLDDGQKLYYDLGTSEKNSEIPGKLTKEQYNKLDARQKYLYDIEQFEAEEDFNDITETEYNSMDKYQQFLFDLKKAENLLETIPKVNKRF